LAPDPNFNISLGFLGQGIFAASISSTEECQRRSVMKTSSVTRITHTILIHVGLEEKITLIAADGEVSSGSLFPAAATFETGSSGLDLKVGLGVFYPRLNVWSSTPLIFLIHSVIAYICFSSCVL